MRAIIAGGTGFIGRHLSAELAAHGWEVVILSRSPSKVAETFHSGVIGMPWDNGWTEFLDDASVIVNLAGSNIASGRWNESVKERILSSRIRAGQRIVEAIRDSKRKPAALIQGSAVGFYGPRNDNPVDESTESGTGFLASVTREWEASTREPEDLGVRRAVIRTGMVLGHGGALERMLPPFRLFAGGPVGSGRQGVSWIHMQDQVRAIRFLMETDSASGPYNLTAPTPVIFRKFARTLGEAMRRPSWLPAPAFALRLLFGEMADEVLLSGQLALPSRLLEAGFEFRFPELAPALEDLLD